MLVMPPPPPLPTSATTLLLSQVLRSSLRPLAAKVSGRIGVRDEEGLTPPRPGRFFFCLVNHRVAVFVCFLFSVALGVPCGFFFFGGGGVRKRLGLILGRFDFPDHWTASTTLSRNRGGVHEERDHFFDVRPTVANRFFFYSSSSATVKSIWDSGAVARVPGGAAGGCREGGGGGGRNRPNVQTTSVTMSK